MLELMSNELLKEIVKEILEAGIYSIIVDKITNLIFKEQLSILLE